MRLFYLKNLKDRLLRVFGFSQSKDCGAKTGDKLSGQEKIQNALGYHFKDTSLLTQFLTHKSYANEKKASMTSGKGKVEDNERLEFLGDSVIEMVVSEYLVRLFPGWCEGELSKVRGYVVSKPVLADIAELLGLGEYMLLGNGEEQSGGRKKQSLLSNTFEAFIGSVFMDGGLEVAKENILRHMVGKIDCAVRDNMFRDSKSLMQEYAQANLNCVPKYKVVRETGPSHDKVFEVTVEVSKKVIGEGVGKTRKEAEQMAAKNAMESMQDFNLCQDKEKPILA